MRCSIDGLILGLPWGIGFLVIAFDANEAFDASTRMDVPLWFSVLSVVAFAGYNVVGTALWGQTIGKHVLEIRVVSARDLGRPDGGELSDGGESSSSWV